MLEFIIMPFRGKDGDLRLPGHDLEETTIELDGRRVLVRQMTPLQDFIAGLNLHDPRSEVFVRSRVGELRVLFRSAVYPAAGICTDGEILGVNRNTLDVSGASYLGWVTTEYRQPEREESPRELTSEGKPPTYFLMTTQYMHEVRSAANSIPGNTTKLVNWG